jgi:hypothetical protein
LAGKEDLGCILAAVYWPLVLLMAPLEEENEAVNWPARISARGKPTASASVFTDIDQKATARAH